jgi:UDP-3-O-[3-hydroxymyristoyl] N-acetylglucosamine deacetylase
LQTTLESSIIFSGVGLHSGKSVSLSIKPASENHGILFKRKDIEIGNPIVRARWDYVSKTTLCTRITNEDGTAISTIEHLMAALAGCGVSNALIEIDSEEVPILDGSAAPFVKGILETGLKIISSSSRIIKITRPVMFENQFGWARLSPFKRPEMEYFIEFDDLVIGKQSKILNMSNGSFVKELCSSRTFCSNKDVENMRRNGLALGGNYSNALVVDGDKVLSPGGMRYQDEAVRHKMLDAFGDLALAGAPILGKYEGHKAGHFITNSLLRKLFSKPDCYVVENCCEDVFNRLPGSGVNLDEFTAVA